MKTLTPEFQAHLDSGATTLCWCWRLVRNDGQAFGFCDHDHPLVFDGLAYEPESGFESTEMTSSTGLNVDNLDAMGALVSNRLNEADLAAGLFDNAEVSIFRVNWSNPEQRILMRRGNLGEVSRADEAFTAEVRGLAHLLNQPTGRIFQYGCDAELGGSKCGIDLEAGTYKATGTVISSEGNRSFHAGGLEGFADAWFAFGKLRWLGGANAGREMEVKTHRKQTASSAIGLWLPMSEAIAPGDAFTIFAGCDKQFATCRGKFANGLNFRGFPHMPGNDFALSYPARDDRDNDGGSLLT